MAETGRTRRSAERGRAVGLIVGQGWGGLREGDLCEPNGLGRRAGPGFFGPRKGLGRPSGRRGWGPRRLPGLAHGAGWLSGWGRAGPRRWRAPSWTRLRRLQPGNLGLWALPLPNPRVLKRPRHLRLQEGKDPEKRIADHMDLFPGLKKKKKKTL